MDIFTIGVYGSTEQKFFGKLAENGIDTFCDIRQRRGVRGSQYAFVNSNRLQNKLAEMGISYTYLKELSPTKEIREKQKEADKRNGIQKKDRTRLGDVFINGYREHIGTKKEELRTKNDSGSQPLSSYLLPLSSLRLPPVDSGGENAQTFWLPYKSSVMAQVIIVSRTRMAGDCVCVGGVDVDNRRSVRLLNARGHHETATDCPYQIWEIWDIDYCLNQRRPNPHTEDVNVLRRRKIDAVDAPNMSVNRFAGVLESSNIPIFRGSLFTVFDGRLKLTDADKMYISKEDVPNYGTKKEELRTKNDSGSQPLSSYLLPLSSIGSLIRLVGTKKEELRTKNDSGSQPLSSYLLPLSSLSGCLIQGHAEEESVNQMPLVEANVAPTPADDHVALPVGEALKGIPCKLMRTNKTYEGTNIPMLALSLSKTFQGQEELTLTKDVFEAIFDLLKSCIIRFDDATGEYQITLSRCSTNSN